ncbi:hypothetical protein ACS126_03500 [Sphingobacterium lactis]|uniref:hypothetical protein n=1 Tax=Sphingobacterium TaxID=28453 RepID=UPI0021A7BE5B|nr:hypothetical protein [Sphingobacterium hotanense]MCT1526089.1 hypothetical protein [Sphingobacterium hotanense]
MITQKTFSNKEALAYCLKLTEKGAKLSARWDGGFETLCIQLYLDERLFIDGKRSQKLSRYIAKHIVHKKVEAFQPPGYIQFDRVSARLLGRDMYSLEAEEQGRFEFEVKVPSDLWFDKVLIEIESVYGAAPTTIFEFSFQNGPIIPEMYTVLQDQLIARLTPEVERFLEEIMEKKEILVLGDRFVLSRDEFNKEGGMLKYKLNQLSYTYEKVAQSSIIIDFKSRAKRPRAF